MAYRDGQNNLGTKLYSSGASAADFRQAWVTLSTLSSTLNTNGVYNSVDSGIRAQSTAVSNLSQSSVNPYTLLSQVRQFVPAVQLAAVNAAVAQVNTSSKQSLLANGTQQGIAQYIATLQACESAVGGGVATVKYGIQHEGVPALRKVNLCAPAMMAGVFALAAIFAPEVEIGVLFGEVLTARSFFGIGSALYSISASITC